MGLLDDCFCHVRPLDVVIELRTVIDLVNVFIDRQRLVYRLVHSLIVRFEIHGCDITISINNMPEKIATHDSDEGGVLILQPLQVHVFDSVYDLVLEGFIHCACIILYYMSFS